MGTVEILKFGGSMLHFFRKYQRYFFVVITTVIVISFSFFGTYSTISGPNPREATAFVAIDGSSVTRAELDDMVNFLSSDNEDKLLSGGVWGPNFLNDGVIKKSFLENGLSNILAAQYVGDIKEDLQKRLDKEKNYVPYTHPQASFINADNAWSYFAPEVKTNLVALQRAASAADSASDPAAFVLRTNLHLAERKFPSSALRQVLRYQEKQYQWVMPDPDLMSSSIALFGYRGLDDWFGPRFIRVVGQFVINAAKIAEQKGYKVTNEEALVDLLRNAEISYKQNLNSPQVGVANREEYFSEQLRRLGLDQSSAIKTWRQVLLFRRLFQDMGNSVFVDSLAFQSFGAYAKESLEGDLYRLPDALHFGSFRSLQLFEAYLEAVTKKDPRAKNMLALPKTFKSPSEVLKLYPELVQKKYLVNIAQVDKLGLQEKVSLKDTWNWELEDANWAALKKNFPELSAKESALKAGSREERFALLEGLDSNTRAKVDEFARLAIVDAHPEWLEGKLQGSQSVKKVIALRSKGGETPVQGLVKRDELIRLLDAAPLYSEQSSELPVNANQKKLDKFSGDGKMFYRIQVIERVPDWQILSFKEALQDEALNQLLKDQLEIYYAEAQKSQPELYQNSDNTFKPLSDVQDLLALKYYDKLLGAIKDDFSATLSPEQRVTQSFSYDVLAAHRLFWYVRQAKAAIVKNPQGASSEWYLVGEKASDAANALQAEASLQDQWKLAKEPFKMDRSSNTLTGFGDQDPFALPVHAWSGVNVSPNGGISFFEISSKGLDEDLAVVTSKMKEAHGLLSADAQRMLMQNLLKEIVSKKAISLDYLKVAYTQESEQISVE